MNVNLLTCTTQWSLISGVSFSSKVSQVNEISRDEAKELILVMHDSLHMSHACAVELGGVGRLSKLTFLLMQVVEQEMEAAKR